MEYSLLLATGFVTILLLDASDDLAQHDTAVAIHEGNTRETLAILECVTHKRLLWLERHLGHLVGFQGVRVLHLLATSLFAHLPLECGDTACGAATTHKSNGRVAHLNLVRDVKDLDLGIEFLGLTECLVTLVHHHITATRHVLLVQALDVEADVVTRLGLFRTLVVHLHGEHLASARVGGSVGWQEDDLLTRLDNTLLNTSSQHITDTFNLVDARDRHAHWGTHGSFWHFAHLVKEIVDCVDVDLLAVAIHIVSSPPTHVLHTLSILTFQEIVSHPARDGQEWNLLLDHVLLPANLDQHAPHLVGDLIVSALFVASSVAIHLVATNCNLLHTQQIDETRVLTSLSLDLTSLVVALGDGCGEISIAWNHDERHISLGSTSNHVLDEITVTWGINDGVMPFLSVELLGGARNGHTTLTLLLLPVHVEGKCERGLAKALCLCLQLLQLSLWDATKLEDQSASGGRLTTVNVTTDDNGQMLLLGIGWHAGKLDGTRGQNSSVRAGCDKVTSIGNP